MTEPLRPTPARRRARHRAGVAGRWRRSGGAGRWRRAALVVAAVVAVVAVGRIAVFYWGISERDTATADRSPLSTDPAAAVPARPSASAPPVPVEVVAPATLDGRPRLADPEVARQVADLRALLAGPVGASGVGAAYGTAEPADQVLVAAVAAPVDDPQARLGDVFGRLRMTGLVVTGVRPVPAAGPGGTARCGVDDRDAARPAVVCGWADRYGCGLVVHRGAPAAQALQEFPAVRAAVERPRG